MHEKALETAKTVLKALCRGGSMCYKIVSYGVCMTREDVVDLGLLILLIAFFCVGAWNTHRLANERGAANVSIISTTIEG